MILTLLVLLAASASPQVSESLRVPVPVEQVSVIRGQLLVKADGEALAGHLVELRGGGLEPLATVTDGLGYYEFPRPLTTGGVLQVHAGLIPGIRFEVNGLAVSQMGDGPLIWAVRKPTRVFQGVALDFDLRTPLANSFIKITEPDGPSEVCATDEGGHFVSEVEFAKSRLSVVPWDNGPLAQRAGRDLNRLSWDPLHVDEPTYVALRVGHRLELKFEPALGSEPFEYKVILRKAGSLLASRVQGEQELLLHREPGDWVRAPRGVGEYKADTAGMELVVYLESPPRAWRGVIPERGFGECKLRAVPCGALLGRIGGAGGIGNGHWADPFFEARSLDLEFLSIPIGWEQPLSFSHRIPLNGDFRIHGIQAGRWRVAVRSPGFVDYETELQIAAGGEVSLRHDLGSPKPVGEVLLRLVSARGDVPERTGPGEVPNFSAELLGTDGSVYRVESFADCGFGVDGWFRRVQHEGQWVMEARVPRLPDDEYRVVVTSRDRYAVQEDGLVRPGQVEQFTLYPPRSQGAYGILPPEEGGPPHAYYRLESLSRDPAFPLTRHPMQGGVHGFDIPGSAELSWCYFQAGYQRVYGDRSSFVPMNGGHWASIDLVPGYSIRLKASLEDGSPGAHLALTFDGKRFTTNAQGEVLLRTSAEHPRTHVQLESCSIVNGDLSPAGKFGFAVPDLRVTVRERAR
jgi:hypothetical protein